MNLLQKLVLGASGFGLVVLGADYLKHRNDIKLLDYPCPFCHVVHERISENQWIMHIAEMQRGVR